MLSTEAYIIDAAGLFFAAWAVALLALNVVVFGKDLIRRDRFAPQAPSSRHRPDPGPSLGP
jgi:hypothetical protein